MVEVKFGNDTIEVADAVRVLGVLVSPDLCLDEHVTAVSAPPSASFSCVSSAESDAHSTRCLWRR